MHWPNTENLWDGGMLHYYTSILCLYFSTLKEHSDRARHLHIDRCCFCCRPLLDDLEYYSTLLWSLLLPSSHHQHHYLLTRSSFHLWAQISTCPSSVAAHTHTTHRTDALTVRCRSDERVTSGRHTPLSPTFIGQTPSLIDTPSVAVFNSQSMQSALLSTSVRIIRGSRPLLSRVIYGIVVDVTGGRLLLRRSLWAR